MRSPAAITKTTAATEYVCSIGGWGVRQSGLNVPVDVAVGSDGRFFVINRSYAVMSGSPRRHGVAGEPVELLFTRASILNESDEVPVSFAPEGMGDGELIWAAGVATDNNGDVYISDNARHDIQVFDSEGSFVRKWGSEGHGPSGLAFDGDGNLLVADSLNNRVQTFASDGLFLACWGSAGNGPGELNNPWGITVDAKSFVYVADWGNDRVQKLDSDGRHLATFGRSGNAVGQLRRPSSVAVDSLGYVYVSDLGNNRVQVFASDGTPVATLLGEATLSKAGKRWFDAHASHNHERNQEASGVIEAGERTFRGPSAVKIDHQGRLLVVDTGRHRIQVYARS